MGYAIQEGDLVPYQLIRERKRRNTPPSNTLNEIRDEQKKLNSKMNKLIEIMARSNLISLTGYGEDDDVEMN